MNYRFMWGKEIDDHRNHWGECRYLATKKRINPGEFSITSGMNTSYIGQIERGEKNPTVKTLEKNRINT